MTKTLLIVHTENASRRKHFMKAREYADTRLLLIKKNPTWERDYVDAGFDVDTSDIAATVRAVADIAKSEHIDGVVTFVEHSVPSAAAAAAFLGLPFVSEETAEVARDKYEMRRRYERGGLRNPRFALARSLDEARSVVKSVGYPLVLKPLIGGGSMFVRRIDDDAELAQHFEYIRSGAWDGFEYDPLYAPMVRKYEGAILLEEYIAGGEVSVESLVIEGRTEVLAIHDKPLPMVGPFFEEHYYATPSRLPEDMQRQLKDATAKGHAALGIATGATHTEFRITETGPVILETAARMGGGPVYRSVLTSTGVDMVHAVMDIALGRNPRTSVAEPRPTGFRLVFAEPEGKITDIAGAEEFSNVPGVLEVELYKKVGDMALRAPKTFQAHGHFIVHADTMDEVEALVQRGTSEVRIATDGVGA